MTDAPFYAVRRLRGGYYEPTLYKRRAAAEAFANARRGYDVVALTFAETAAKYAQQVRDTCVRAERAEADDMSRRTPPPQLSEPNSILPPTKKATDQEGETNA